MHIYVHVCYVIPAPQLRVPVNTCVPLCTRVYWLSWTSPHNPLVKETSGLIHMYVFKTRFVCYNIVHVFEGVI